MKRYCLNPLTHESSTLHTTPGGSSYDRDPGPCCFRVNRIEICKSVDTSIWQVMYGASNAHMLYHISISIAKMENSTHVKSGTHPTARSRTRPHELGQSKAVHTFVRMHDACFGAKGGSGNGQNWRGDRFSFPYKKARFSTTVTRALERQRRQANRCILLCSHMHSIIRQSGVSKKQELEEEIGLPSDGA